MGKPRPFSSSASAKKMLDIP
jgi:hypothetical protein